MRVFTVPMRLLTAVVLDEASDAVKRELLSLGVLDFIKVSHLAPEDVSRLHRKSTGFDMETLVSLKNQVETLFVQASQSLPSTESLNPLETKGLDLNKERMFIDRIVADVALLRDKQRQISQSRIRNEELLHYINQEQSTYIDLLVGTIEKSDVSTLRQRLSTISHLLIEEEKTLILLTLRRDRQSLTSVLETFNWVEKSDAEKQSSALGKAKEGLLAEQKELDKANDEAKKAIVERIDSDVTRLRELWGNLKLHELLGLIDDNFSHTRNTTIFSGWVPASDSQTLEQAIREASQGACVVEWIADQQMSRSEIPVAVEDVPLLRPFQKLVDNYSTPEYGTINPTPFVAVSYLFMFGLMFADAGQGLVILLLGLLGSRFWGKKKEGKTPLISNDLYKLLVYLGGASIIAGVLFGSYFGFPLFKPLWFNYHEAVMGGERTGRTVYTILGITVWFGIIVISTGLILNWINLIRKKEWFTLIMDKNGILGGWLFALGVWAAFAFVGTGYKSLPPGKFLPVALAIPLFILVAKVPLKRVLGYDKEPKGIGTLIMDTVLEWVVDVLEIFAGFLANTLSFMRVAGLGIAHVSLMVAFSEMANLTSGIPAILIYVAGNALIIALEGLSAGIQALRLNYYEFFTKYFTGRGLSYNPISLRSDGGKHIRIRT